MEVNTATKISDSLQRGCDKSKKDAVSIVKGILKMVQITKWQVDAHDYNRLIIT